MTTVTITRNDDRVTIDAPYHPEFPRKAKAIGGKWSPAQRVWAFDARDEGAVRNLATEIYGTDGSTPTELVTVRAVLTATYHATNGHYVGGTDTWMFGRNILHKSGRDTTPRLGEGVVVVDGELAARGGSAKYPAITFETPTLTVEIRDVPRELVEEDEYVHIVSADAPESANPLASINTDDLISELKRRGYTVSK